MERFWRSTKRGLSESRAWFDEQNVMKFHNSSEPKHPHRCHISTFISSSYHPSNPLVTPTEPHTLRVHLVCIRIGRSLSRRQLLRGRWSICIIICPIQMRHLMQNTACLVIIIIRTSRSIFREIPVAIIWARHNSVVAWYSVEQSAAVGTVTVDVGAVY
jgi:hypothetical protein